MTNPDHCPWCRHIFCDKCDEERNAIFPKLYLGCCGCGEKAEMEAHRMIEEAREQTK